MKKNLLFFILVLFLVLPQLLFSQDKKPKVALVLSGGGAKGIAHIPLLQVLDSLGIVPDIVIGTSMGSVVGGLYAMGYSGDSIASIVKDIDWDELLGGDVLLEDVSIEEKSEFKKYLIELDLVKGKPKLSPALLSDQKLREYLSLLTYPVFNINNFDDLPIPFRAMTTDIVNGKEVILSEGFLSKAMRASMSIPGVFRPVPYKNTLLVDGGVLNNFPTDVAKRMGYDIIIGSDVSGGMIPKEGLISIPSFIFQASMLTSNLKNPENKKLCHILIDHVPYLTYGTGDFGKGNELYEQGKIAASKNINELAVLAKKLKGYKQRDHKIPDKKNEFILDTIIYSGISEANLDLVKSRTNLKTNKKYTVQDLIDGVERAMGTTVFSQITYESVKTEDGGVGLHLTGFEHSKNRIKGSLHYDTYRGVGLVVNYIGRNIIGEASRLLVTIDIAEQPRYRLQYQKHFGNQKTWWWKSEVFGELLEQRVFIKGNATDDILYHYFQFDNQINKNLNSLSSFVGVGVNYKYTNLKPKTDPDISDNVVDLKRYSSNNFEIYAHYLFNDMNNVYAPTYGTYFKTSIRRSLYHNVDLEYFDQISLDVKGETNGFTKIGLDFEKRFQLQKKITGIIGTTANFIFMDNLQSNDLSFSDYGYASRYFLGGSLISPRKGSFSFSGLYDDELNVTQFMKLNLGVQFNPIKKLFLTPHFDIASVGFGDFSDYIKNSFSPKGGWEEGIETSTLMSAGVKVTYFSFLGPVDFDVAWVNDINKVRLFFSIGLQFNRSN